MDLESDRKEVAENWGKTCPSLPQAALSLLPGAPTYASIANMHVQPPAHIVGSDRSTEHHLGSSHWNVKTLQSEANSAESESNLPRHASSEILSNRLTDELQLCTDYVCFSSTKRIATTHESNTTAKKGKNTVTSIKGKVPPTNLTSGVHTPNERTYSGVTKLSLTSSSKQTLSLTTQVGPDLTQLSRSSNSPTKVKKSEDDCSPLFSNQLQQVSNYSSDR